MKNPFDVGGKGLSGPVGFALNVLFDGSQIHRIDDKIPIVGRLNQWMMPLINGCVFSGRVYSNDNNRVFVPLIVFLL